MQRNRDSTTEASSGLSTPDEEMPEYLYHYCSNDSLLDILVSHKVRLSDLSLSNDSLEGQWVREVLQKIRISSDGQRSWADEAERIFNRVRVQVLGFCMSEAADLLSQWRGYADQGAGSCIGFRTSSLRHLPLSELTTASAELAKIEYEFQAQCRSLNEVFAQLTPEDFPFQGLSNARLEAIVSASRLFHVFKNPAFSEEKEWRIVAIKAVFQDLPSGGPEPSMPVVSYRSRGNKIVPYRDLAIQPSEGRSAIGRIVLGPRNETPIEVIKAVLEANSYSDVEVSRSTASFR